ncbi:hypothetical protein BPAE_0030g00520 [Botrytis paeoniae]|uniref:Uncharacterized protein n=1 Tax=Botrytis paeoniae TaxID=278948 RepID=A0A4Z1FU50_9HELO|nr:hypothetical protein BPAE_0030g00520 [Botrytis paeoniae]
MPSKKCTSWRNFYLVAGLLVIENNINGVGSVLVAHKMPCIIKKFDASDEKVEDGGHLSFGDGFNVLSTSYIPDSLQSSSA